MTTPSAFVSACLAPILAAFTLTAAIVAPAAGAAIPEPAAAVQGAPASPTDGSKVPHYFGPYPNWANSPLTKPNATVTIAGGGGTGGQGVAQVDPVTGGVAAITVTNPGSGYTSAPTVSIGGGNGAATATAVITSTGAVTGFAISAAGSGYSSFEVAVTGGGGTAATALASGGVDAVAISNGGADYTLPVVEFGLPDEPDGIQAKGHVPRKAAGDAEDGISNTGAITKVIIDTPGSGYHRAPEVVIHNGTLFDPLGGETPATVKSTLKLTQVKAVEIGSGYTSAPTVTITDPTGSGTGATATAKTTAGSITDIKVGANGSGYLTTGIKKFQDALPVTCDPAIAPASGGCPEDGGASKFLPTAVPEKKTYNGVEADEIVIGLVQYRTKFNKDLPATLTRGYVQIETAAQAGISEHFKLQNEMLDGSKADTGYFGVTAPQWLGPFINATKDRPVRVIFRNLLPTGSKGDLFLPVDSSMMGSGMGPQAMAAPPNDGTVMDEVRNPHCTQNPKMTSMCFADNRATLHLHGGVTPWISDGTPHQWITPANEATAWPEGVSVRNVPDMTNSGCDADRDGCSTFYYTNQQSARLMFYHDHSWGTTRLNVYAGEAAGYTITDDTEKSLISKGLIPGAADTMPLIVQDRTFTPDAAQLAEQDPTWDTNRWGTKGSFWYHHVYMPAQNPGDPSGMSAYGRWMYGPWFWPPAADTKYGPIKNPYYDSNCKLDDPATWTYQTDPYCEPEKIPGTPNISAGMEQFNDTPIVNGIAYPKVTLQPKSYRFRMLNAANDRFFNFQWYTADSTYDTEVTLNAADLEAAQNEPTISPRPALANNNAAGPDWYQIANEGGFLPAPAVIDGQQPTTWITDPTRFDVGNVDKHSLLLAPAERADVVVDFSKFAGKTLILYNDAPAAFPARVPQYDYYTGAPDLSPAGAPSILPGYGPNTRTIMQVKIAAATPATAFNLSALQTAFKHTPSKTGVFEAGQHPAIVGQSAYNSAYGTAFAAGSYCNGASVKQTCDGYVRINDTGSIGFNTLKTPGTRQVLPQQPKAIHDEMNSTTFDEFGRMSANLGIEASPPTPGAQNVTLYPFVNPPTELIDATKLPKDNLSVTPISSMDDGTQIWRITHNGVDTHPIHFHLYDVQLLNRVAWDNIMQLNDPNENGWKDTVRISPLQDTFVALRPVVPKLPFEIPNSVRALNPMMPLGSTEMFNSRNGQGEPTAAITNRLVNFGWEYIWHCHILSHEEMDMMRPQSLAVPPIVPDGLKRAVAADGKVSVSWNDNSITETTFVLQRSTDGNTWADVGKIDTPLDQPNTHGVRTLPDPAATPTSGFQYRVIAQNAIGYGGDFPGMTVQSTSAVLTSNLPVAPSTLVAQKGVDTSAVLTWTDNSTNETGYVVERSVDNGATWTALKGPAAPLPADSTTYTDTPISRGVTYSYRVAALNPAGGAYSNVATLTLVSAPTNLTATAATANTVKLAWTDTATNETNFAVQRSTDGGTTWSEIATPPTAAGAGTTVAYTDATPPLGVPLSYRVAAVNGADSVLSNVATVSLVIAPDALMASVQAGPSVDLSWTDNATNETGFVVERSADNGTTWTQIGPAALPANTTAFTDTQVTRGTTYLYRVASVNATSKAYSNTVTTRIGAAPSALTTLTLAGPKVVLTWSDNSITETSYVVQRQTGTGAWATVTTLPADSTTWTDAAASADVKYSYRVGAVTGGDTALSNVATVTVIAAPSNLTLALSANPTRVRLLWKDISATETGYNIWRSVDGGVTWKQIGSRGVVSGTGTSLTWTDSAPVLGSTGTYKLQILNAAGSAWSNEASVLVSVPPTPSNVAGTATATGTTSMSFKVTWADTQNETGYTVQWSNDGVAITGTANVAANTTTYTRSSTRRLIYVRVRANNQIGSSAYSAWVAVPKP